VDDDKLLQTNIVEGAKKNQHFLFIPITLRPPNAWVLTFFPTLWMFESTSRGNPKTVKTRPWIAGILILLALCSYLFYALYDAERTRAIEAVISQQRILAKQAARSLNELFSKWNSVLSYLSTDENVVVMNDQGKRVLSQLQEILSGEIKSITRTNREGVILYTAPYFPNSVGRNISHQKHMTRILADHKPVVSDVFDAVQGFQAIAIHYPVVKKGVFDGTLAFVIDFGRVGRTILEEIGSDGSGYAWMLSAEGIELYCPVPGHIGKSVRETTDGFPDLQRVVEDMLAGQEGSSTYTYNMDGKERRMTRRIVYYLPVPINETFWPLAIAYTEENITASLSSFSTNLLLIIGVMFVGGVFISYFGIKAWLVVRESAVRAKADEQLRESEERYRNLYNNAAIGICRMTPEGNMIFANPHLVKMLGFDSFEDLVGHTRGDGGLTLNRRSDQFRPELQEAKEIRGHESKWQKKDGSEIFVRENVRVFHNPDGSVAYYDITAEDITEQRQLQSQLIQSQKMEAIGQLAGGVAHDFNNMIGVILGYATVLDKELGGSESARKKIRSILTAAERSANLARQLLAFARRQVITPIVINLNYELTSIQRVLERLIGENITLRLVLAPALWNVKIDPVQVDQVVTNLCTNARDAIDNIGTITIETSNVTVEVGSESAHSGLAPGDYVTIRVTDTGRGMDRNMLERIFEPFFTTKPKGTGTGLGLATVFGIVKQNHGHIEVSTESGKGTSFTVYFARSFGTARDRQEEPVADSRPGSGTVLVVEDEPELLALMASTLESNGYKVLSTVSPQRALEMFAQSQNKIDLLVTDVIMPEMNGKQLQERITEGSPSTKTLFVSGYAADVVAERGVLEEETHFLQKPFAPAALIAKVHALLSRP
jgi:PAS domain S-box-containing protein